MKGLTPVLLLSVVANLALGALILTRRAPADAAPATEPVATGAAAAGNTRTRDAAPAAAAPTTGTPGPLAPDPVDVDYVARLRASGMPATLVRDLTYLRMYRHYRDRRRALLPENDDRYWLSWTQTGLQGASPETRAKLRELDKEMEARIRALLGDGPDSLNSYQRRLYDQLADSVPSAKVQQIEAIRKDYDEMIANVRTQGKGLVLKADREQLRLLEKERRRDLQAVLSPEELLEYDLRANPMSQGLRNRLAYFEPSEQEFRAVAKLQIQFDQQYGLINLSGAEQDQRKAAEKDLTAQIRNVLTPARFDDYLVTIDGMFSETRRFTNAYNLDPTVAKEIVALKQSTWKRVDALDQAGMAGDQRAAALKALEQEVEGQLTTRLGAEVFGKYQKSGASWMNRLRPTPPRP